MHPVSAHSVCFCLSAAAGIRLVLLGETGRFCSDLGVSCCDQSTKNSQFEQIFPYWVLGMLLGSAVSVFAKGKIHTMMARLQAKRLGVLGVVPASILGIASPLCMYGTIPLAASFSQMGMRDDLLAAFMMSSILLNPQLIVYSAALGSTALTVRLVSCFFCGVVAGLLVRFFYGNKTFFDFSGFSGP